MEVMEGLIYLITLIFIILAIIFSFIFGKRFKPSYNYVIFLLVVLLLAAYGHHHYYVSHGLNIIPNGDEGVFFAGASLLGMAAVFFIEFFYCRVTQQKRPSIKRIVVLFVSLIVLFTWLMPLGNKYHYVKRLDLVEETFASKDSGKVVTDEDITIGLVESTDNPLVRSVTHSGAYHNYLYIKNSRDTPFEESISIIFYNENNNPSAAKVFEGVSVPPNSMQLLTENEDAMRTDKWNLYTHRTDQEIVSFDVW